jgi:hypothetical protein
MGYTKEARERNKELNQNHSNMSTKTAGAEKVHPNEGLGLEAIDYKAMRGAMYRKYLDIVEGKLTDPDNILSPRSGGLNGNKKYIFEVYNVEPHQRALYPGVPNSPRVADGFELRKDKPVQVVTTFLKDALLLNAQLYAKIAPGAELQILYYLLQKPTNDAK